jgi:hypothetical protein
MELIFFLFTTLVIIALLLAFHRKMALQLTYLEVEAKKKNLTPAKHFLFFDWKNVKERELRSEAFLLFPMLYGLTFEEEEPEELVAIKQKIKRSHIVIYFCIIAFIILGIYSERILPA